MTTFRPMMTAEQKSAMEKHKSEINRPIDVMDNHYWPQTIEFTTEQLPEVSKWEVGKVYEITVKVKMKSYEQKKSDRSGEGKKEKEQGRFEIIAVKSDGKGLNGEQKKIMDFMKEITKLKIILSISIILIISLIVGVSLFIINKYKADVLGKAKVDWILPNYKFTPGQTNIDLTKKVICDKNFRTSNYRNVPESLKNKVYELYGIKSHTKGQYEIDHLISLVNGGSNDIKNLWPQPADPRPGFKEKDTCEVKIHNLICSDKLTLKQGQDYLVHFNKYCDKINQGIAGLVDNNFLNEDGAVE